MIHFLFTFQALCFNNTDFNTNLKLHTSVYKCVSQCISCLCNRSQIQLEFCLFEGIDWP